MLRIIGEGKLRLLGLHAHSGTMLHEARPYQECVERLLTLANEVYTDTQWWPQEISPGGGWAIDTLDADATPAIEVLAQALQYSMERGLATINNGLPAPTLVMEPGRSIIARAGVAIYRVGVRKPTPGGVTYLFVDGGMADNIRPALYGATYTAFAANHGTHPQLKPFALRDGIVSLEIFLSRILLYPVCMKVIFSLYQLLEPIVCRCPVIITW